MTREIRIRTHQSDTYTIDGLEEFEKFNENFIRRTSNVQISEYQELIDFDHPLYYVCLGTAVGVAATFLFRLVSAVGSEGLRLIQLLIACFVILTGMFFVLAKPIRGRCGNRKRTADYTFGLIFLAAGIMIII